MGLAVAGPGGHPDHRRGGRPGDGPGPGPARARPPPGPGRARPPAAVGTGDLVTLWQRIVEANRPGPPEHSRLLRGASVAAVVVAAGACYHERELGLAAAVFTVVASVVGNVI